MKGTKRNEDYLENRLEPIFSKYPVHMSILLYSIVLTLQRGLKILVHVFMSILEHKFYEHFLGCLSQNFGHFYFLV